MELDISYFDLRYQELSFHPVTDVSTLASFQIEVKGSSENRPLIALGSEVRFVSVYGVYLSHLNNFLTC